MAKAIKIAVFAGSARRDSFNKKLAKVAASIAEDQGFDVTLIDLADFEAPVYSGDIEADSGLPESMRKLKTILASQDGFLISTCLLYTSPSPRDRQKTRMPSSA